MIEGSRGRRQRDDAGRIEARGRCGDGFRRPTLINAEIDPAAGSESGNIGNLNPKSALGSKSAPAKKGAA